MNFRVLEIKQIVHHQLLASVSAVKKELLVWNDFCNLQFMYLLLTRVMYFLFQKHAIVIHLGLKVCPVKLLENVIVLAIFLAHNVMNVAKVQIQIFHIVHQVKIKTLGHAYFYLSSTMS